MSGDSDWEEDIDIEDIKKVLKKLPQENYIGNGTIAYQAYIKGLGKRSDEDILDDWIKYREYINPAIDKDEFIKLDQFVVDQAGDRKLYDPTKEDKSKAEKNGKLNPKLVQKMQNKLSGPSTTQTAETTTIPTLPQDMQSIPTTASDKPGIEFTKPAQEVLNYAGKIGKLDLDTLNEHIDYLNVLKVTLDRINEYDDLTDISGQIVENSIPATWKGIANLLDHKIKDRLPEEPTEYQKAVYKSLYTAHKIANFLEQDEIQTQLDSEELLKLKNAFEAYKANKSIELANGLSEVWEEQKDLVKDIEELNLDELEQANIHAALETPPQSPTTGLHSVNLNLTKPIPPKKPEHLRHSKALTPPQSPTNQRSEDSIDYENLPKPPEEILLHPNLAEAYRILNESESELSIPELAKEYIKISDLGTDEISADESNDLLHKMLDKLSKLDILSSASTENGVPEETSLLLNKIFEKIKTLDPKDRNESAQKYGKIVLSGISEWNFRHLGTESSEKDPEILRAQNFLSFLGTLSTEELKPHLDIKGTQAAYISESSRPEFIKWRDVAKQYGENILSGIDNFNFQFLEDDIDTIIDNPEIVKAKNFLEYLDKLPDAELEPYIKMKGDSVFLESSAPSSPVTWREVAKMDKKHTDLVEKLGSQEDRIGKKALQNLSKAMKGAKQEKGAPPIPQGLTEGAIKKLNAAREQARMSSTEVSVSTSDRKGRRATPSPPQRAN